MPPSQILADQRQISLLVYVAPKADLHQGLCRFSQHASRFWQHRRCYWTAAASSNTTCPPRFLDLAPSLEYSRVSKVSKILCSRIQQSSKSWVCSRKSIFKVIVNHLSHEYQVRGHSSITSSKRWVGGVRKVQFLMIYSTVNHQRVGWVGLKK